MVNCVFRPGWRDDSGLEAYTVYRVNGIDIYVDVVMAGYAYGLRRKKRGMIWKQ